MEERIAGGNSKRRVQQRQEQAIARHAARDKRTSRQQLDSLDEKLGKDAGATKERTRLLQSILDGMHKEVDKIETESKENEKKTKTRLSPKEIKRRRKQHKKANNSQ